MDSAWVQYLVFPEIQQVKSNDFYNSGAALISLSKSSAEHQINYSLAGRLQLSNGWLMVSVPSALIRGAFDALQDSGMELPKTFGIPVMSPQELSSIGGPNKVSERGHAYNYSLGSVSSHEPGKGISKAVYIRILSPDIKHLRISYGLSPYPKGSSFQLPIGLRKTNVLRHNDVSKLASCLEEPDQEEYDLESVKAACVYQDNALLPKVEKPTLQVLQKLAEDSKKKTIAVDLDGTLADYSDGWKGEDHFGKLRPGARQVLKRLHSDGHKIIIHTVRGNTDKVEEWLKDNDIPFHHINENPKQPPNSSSKMIADIYVDDRAVSADKPWSKIHEEINHRIKKSEGHKPVVYLVRHGKTALNGPGDKDKLRGWKDVPLDEEGCKEAERVSEFLEDKDIHWIVSSNLQRAVHTVEPLAKKLGLKINATGNFRPWNVGEYTGMKTLDVIDELHDIAKNKPDFKIPDGESFHSFTRRLTQHLEYILERAKETNKHVVVSAHFRCLKCAEAWSTAGRKDDEQGNPILDMEIFTKDDVPVGSVIKFTVNDKGEWDHEKMEINGGVPHVEEKDAIDQAMVCLELAISRKVGNE